MTGNESPCAAPGGGLAPMNAPECLENRMPRALPGRRALLRAAAASGAALPILAVANRVLAGNRPADFSAVLADPEICHASFKAPVVLAEKRAIKLSFNANDNKWHATMDVNADKLKAAPEYKYSSKS